jgi:hypothetical protein
MELLALILVIIIGVAILFSLLELFSISKTLREILAEIRGECGTHAVPAKRQKDEGWWPSKKNDA